MDEPTDDDLEALEAAYAFTGRKRAIRDFVPAIRCRTCWNHRAYCTCNDIPGIHATYPSIARVSNDYLSLMGWVSTNTTKSRTLKRDDLMEMLKAVHDRGRNPYPVVPRIFTDEMLRRCMDDPSND